MAGGAISGSTNIPAQPRPAHPAQKSSTVGSLAVADPQQYGAYTLIDAGSASTTTATTTNTDRKFPNQVSDLVVNECNYGHTLPTTSSTTIQQPRDPPAAAPSGFIKWSSKQQCDPNFSPTLLDQSLLVSALHSGAVIPSTYDIVLIITPIHNNTIVDTVRHALLPLQTTMRPTGTKVIPTTTIPAGANVKTSLNQEYSIVQNNIDDVKISTAQTPHSTTTVASATRLGTNNTVFDTHQACSTRIEKEAFYFRLDYERYQHRHGSHSTYNSYLYIYLL